MLNHITIMGRLTRDPELRRTQSGTAVCSFTVAVDRDYQNKEASEKAVDFIDCVAWRGSAEFVCKYFTKGRMIVVDGSLQSRKWTDKNGQNRISWEVQSNNLYFGDSKRDGQGERRDYDGGSQIPEGEPESYLGGSTVGYAEIEEDGELPF